MDLIVEGRTLKLSSGSDSPLLNGKLLKCEQNMPSGREFGGYNVEFSTGEQEAALLSRSRQGEVMAIISLIREKVDTAAKTTLHTHRQVADLLLYDEVSNMWSFSANSRTMQTEPSSSTYSFEGQPNSIGRYTEDEDVIDSRDLLL